MDADLSNPQPPAEGQSRPESCVTGQVAGEYWRWCPQCGHELQNERCKLRCPRCRYFMSCSDFD